MKSELCWAASVHIPVLPETLCLGWAPVPSFRPEAEMERTDPGLNICHERWVTSKTLDIRTAQSLKLVTKTISGRVIIRAAALKRRINFRNLFFTDLGVRSNSQPYTAHYIGAHGQI